MWLLLKIEEEENCHSIAIELIQSSNIIYNPLDFHIHSASMRLPPPTFLLLCQICYYIVPDYISQHSSEFTSPAIDLWHEAQEQGHECLWQGFKSRVFHWSRPGFSVISDMLTDVSIHELRLNPGLVKLWKCFGGVEKDCGYIYGADYGGHETGKCWITPISILNCDRRHRYMKYPTFNPCWRRPAWVTLHASVEIKVIGVQDRYDATSPLTSVEKSFDLEK